MDNTTYSEDENSTEQWDNLWTSTGLHTPDLGQSGLQIQDMMVTHPLTSATWALGLQWPPRGKRSKCGKTSTHSSFLQHMKAQHWEFCSAPLKNTQNVYVLERHIIFMQWLMADRCYSLIINLEQSGRLLETNEWSSPKGLEYSVHNV